MGGLGGRVGGGWVKMVEMGVVGQGMELGLFSSNSASSFFFICYQFALIYLVLHDSTVSSLNLLSFSII